MNKFCTGSLLLALAASGVAQAQGYDPTTGGHIERRFYVAPMFSYTFSDHRRGSGDGLGGTLAVGKRVTDYIDLELLGFYSRYDVSGSDAQRVNNAQMAAGFPANNRSGSLNLYGFGGGINVYAFKGLGESLRSHLLDPLYAHIDIMRGSGHGQPGPEHSYTSTIYDLGLGYNLPLPITLGGMLPPGVALRMEAMWRIDQHNRDFLGEGSHKYFQEPMINLGVRIPLGGYPKPAPPPAPEQPVKVVPVAQAAPAAPPPPPPPPPPCLPPAAGQPIDLDGCKAGDTIVLRGVTFDFNKARLTPNAKTILNQVADALVARKDIDVEIDGYTDSVGSDSYNLKLSQRRADSVKQYLIGRGIDAGRMTTKGYGETKPIASNKTDEGREMNRRVELKIMAESAPGEGTSGSSAPKETPPTAPASSSGAPAASGNDGGTPASGGAPSGSDTGGAPPSGGSAPSSDGGSSGGSSTGGAPPV